MVKVDSLSSDIDFIKEFEELKIKQKLLIESLKKKTKAEQSKIFLEINSKLDFLVKIFTEANKTEEENNDEKEHIDSQFNSIIEKVDELSKSFEEKFDTIEKKIDKIEKGTHLENKGNNPIHKPNNNSMSMGSNINNSNNNINASNNAKSTLESKTIENSTSSNNDMPPAPDFESKIDTINNKSSSSLFKFGHKTEESKDETKKKNKKWF